MDIDSSIFETPTILDQLDNEINSLHEEQKDLDIRFKTLKKSTQTINYNSDGIKTSILSIRKSIDRVSRNS